VSRFSIESTRVQVDDDRASPSRSSYDLNTAGHWCEPISETGVLKLIAKFSIVTFSFH
jgi:hypothetical protein